MASQSPTLKEQAADFGVRPGKGRLPRVYFLTRRGVEYLAALWGVDPATIPYPKDGLFSRADYDHRMALIDFEIELRLVSRTAGRGGGILPPSFRHGSRPP